MSLTFVPPWSDACDPKQHVAIEYDDGMGRSYIGFAPSWWPCDEEGNFVAQPHYTAAL
jgi:hypothetical protein